MSIAAGVQLILRRVDTGETCAPPEGMALKIVNALKREEVLGLLHEGRQSSRREFASHSLSNLAALWSTHPEYQALETARG
ncbi:hypothetical protein [Prescottella agglutinans]|uniref:Uncharacterized protein n=1 Tax=Prescottella agglutinans TaxID=1644129 RepID=A0ABT6M5D4_9NOCA|nr:hypothetical protein [Prescottella agglutinans]MDH6279514.1 hypothetical protein [Prescottella agglutinans]